MASEVKHEKILVDNLFYLVSNIKATDTLLWEALIEKGVYSYDDASNLRVSSMEMLVSSLSVFKYV